VVRDFFILSFSPISRASFETSVLKEQPLKNCKSFGKTNRVLQEAQQEAQPTSIKFNNILYCNKTVSKL
jgi:hypothetical protein